MPVRHLVECNLGDVGTEVTERGQTQCGRVVARVDTLIRPVVNHRFVIQTMPPQMPEVIVEARVGPAGEEDEFRYRYRVWGQEATGWRCWIVGDALLRDHVVEYLNQMIVDGLPANEQERLMLEAIAQTETDFTHFAPHTGGVYDSTSVVRYPVESRDHGYGVMQLTPAPTRAEIWNWQANDLQLARQPTLGVRDAAGSPPAE